MKIYYDYQILAAQKFGGISRYIYELASRMPNMGAEVCVECFASINYYFRELGIKSVDDMNILYRKFYYRRNSKLRRIMSRCNVLRSLYRINSGKYDVIHPTYYKPYMIGRMNNKINSKLIITVHDMIYEIYADSYFSQDKVTIHNKRKMILAADMLIAISEKTKQDLLYYYPEINEEKIRVIYHGTSISPAENVKSPLPECDYVLFVGTRGLYKNFTRFMQAMIPVLNKHKDLHLFCAGGGAFTREELDSFGAYKSRIHQGGLSDSELAAAYQNALCFVFPSEYEGFGIPILESFACDCPVICSDSSSLPEVAGSAAEYFSPVDIDMMTDKILDVIEHESLRQELISRGRERVKLFSWDKAARETLECYKLAKEM